MITSHCNDIYLRNILSVEHIMQKLVSVKSPILKLQPRFQVKIAASGRPFSNMASDWLAAVLPANQQPR